ncbi:MAG TPA: uroporphyrinogen-III synthase [Stellaceae bacterium]|nr:uroporphyrinogen-III synthase [Stellaceae bacterium]
MTGRLEALITRPAADAEPLAAALRARGIVPWVEPLLTIRPVAGPPPDLAGVQAILFTSANGVRAFVAASQRRDLPVLAVGDATAAAAEALGFADVASAGGDVASLAALARARLAPEKGALFHAAGSVTAGDLAGELAAAGFALRRAVLYAAEPATALSPALVAAIRRGAIALAFFFSPRTAASFVRLAAAACLAGDAMTALCLSPAVAAALAPLGWRRIVTAAAPRQAALLAALDAFLAGEAAPVSDEG